MFMQWYIGRFGRNYYAWSLGFVSRTSWIQQRCNWAQPELCFFVANISSSWVPSSSSTLLLVLLRWVTILLRPCWSTELVAWCWLLPFDPLLVCICSCRWGLLVPCMCTSRSAICCCMVTGLWAIPLLHLQYFCLVCSAPSDCYVISAWLPAAWAETL